MQAKDRSWFGRNGLLETVILAGCCLQQLLRRRCWKGAHSKFESVIVANCCLQQVSVPH